MASAEPAAGPVSVIVLAAGRGERFIASGGRMHKLDAPLAGRPVLAHVLETVRRAGFEPQLVRPPGGTSGMGESIAMGVRATPDAAGWLILPGDLPLVRAETIAAVAAGLAGHAVVVPTFQGRPGHPVGFASGCFTALAALAGDAGAKAVVQAHRRAGGVLELPVADPGIVLDIDRLDDLRAAERRLAEGHG
jgi:molybdenum cofactor cytidylyltransferase